ncbi:MAG: hypothetical protein E5X28_10525, partial [Mesorhizobium sp.]
DQQVRILEERENTKNAKAELKQSAAEREARRKGSDLRSDTPDLVGSDDRNMLRGKNQESGRNKHRGD